MRFGVLGTGHGLDGRGEPVTIPGLKVRALLADLLVHEGRPVPADRLIDDLWGDDLPGNPSGHPVREGLPAPPRLRGRRARQPRTGESGPAGYSLTVDSSVVRRSDFC